jgi:hypothetical protein
LYVFAPYLIALPFNILFLAYIVLVALSAFTLIGVVACIDGQAVRQRLIGVEPAKTSGGILLGLAILVIVRQVILIITALANHTPVDHLTLAIWIVDLTVQCPALLVVGFLLWRRQALGYVTGAGLLLQYGVLAVGVIQVMALEAFFASTSLNVVDVVVLLVMTAVCFVPLSFFARRAPSDREALLT